MFLKKKTRPVSKSTSINEPVMTQLVVSRIVGADERSVFLTIE